MTDWIAQNVERVEHALSQWIVGDAPAGLGKAMSYAVLNGGKRLRPLLTLAAAEAAEGHEGAALRAACAVELIHAYSLVHDDMPCMDNDVLRRSQPTVHVAFGQWTALLTGDALQALAFELLVPEESDIPSRVQARLCRLLAKAAGHAGMAGGQAIDLASVGHVLDEAQLRQMHRLKAGALLHASVMMGAATGSLSRQADEALSEFGWALGLAFQVVDDILDLTADSAMLGKTAGKDAAQKKPTYASLLGLEASRAYAADLLRHAQHVLASSGISNSQALRALANTLLMKTES